MKIINAEKFIQIIRDQNFPKKGELCRIVEQLSFEAPIGKIPESKEQIDMTNVYYPDPTKVLFKSIDGYSSGIAFREYIIELSTGRPVRIQEILKKAQENGIDLDDAIIEFKWDSII